MVSVICVCVCIYIYIYIFFFFSYRCCWVLPHLKITSLSLRAVQKWATDHILPVSHSLPSCLPIRKANLCNWTSKRQKIFSPIEKTLPILIQVLNKLECAQWGAFKRGVSWETLTWEEQLVEQGQVGEWEVALQWSSIRKLHDTREADLSCTVLPVAPRVQCAVLDRVMSFP